jgi:hypothetical protein
MTRQDQAHLCSRRRLLQAAVLGSIGSALGVPKFAVADEAVPLSLSRAGMLTVSLLACTF